MTILIRHESDSDIPLIRNVVYQAFLNHPLHAQDAKPTEHKIVDELRRSGELAISLVAEMDNEICGHIAFSKILINQEFKHWYGLGPVTVLPSHQNQGIGSALIGEGIALLKTNGAAGIVLLGEPSYYQRFGFQVSDELTLPGVPPEYFMILPLTNDTPKGEAAYHASFYIQ